MNELGGEMRKKIAVSLLCSILLFLSLAIASFSKECDASTQVNILEQIIISKEQNSLEVKILLSRYTKSECIEVSEPNRIVIDFTETKNITASRRIDVNDFGIIAIRAGMYKSDVARVVFDLQDKYPLYRIEDIQGGVRVLFWLKEAAVEKKKEVIREIIQEKDAIGHLNVKPTKANLNDSIHVDMSGSQNVWSMEVDVFNPEGVKIDTIKLTPESSKGETRFDKPGEYIFRGTAFNVNKKPSENLCEARVHINRPPICKSESLYYENYVGSPIILDVSRSIDLDGEVVKAHFTVTDEAQNILDSFTATRKPFVWKKAFEKEGIYIIPIVVMDDSGAVSEPVQAQAVVSSKRVFFMVDGGMFFASGNSYAGYVTSRVGLVLKITPRTLDFIISGGAGQTLQNDPWKSFFTANMLFNYHVGPAFLGIGAGITTKIREDRNPDGELIANVGIELRGKQQSRRSFFFEVRGPVGKGRVFSEHNKMMLGFRFLF